jgi:hypothetical protein
MPRPVHFDITADDPNRAMKFYETVFGWKFQKWDGPMEYYMATTGDQKEPGINGGISKKGKAAMLNMNTMGVPSVDEFSKKVQNGGGKILQPKMPIPGVGWFAVAQDTEGNTFGMMQEDKNAK